MREYWSEWSARICAKELHANNVAIITVVISCLSMSVAYFSQPQMLSFGFVILNANQTDRKTKIAHKEFCISITLENWDRHNRVF